MVELEAQAARFGELEELFELVPSNYQELADTRRELVLLKTAWDMTVLVQMVFEAWQLTLWGDIDAETMLDETKKLQVRASPLCGPPPLPASSP